METKLVQIFFFDGDEVRTTEVLRSDLPRLCSARTFWRESMPESELSAKMKQRFAETVGSHDLTGK